ncbi:TPA: hypothetical protein ACQTXI_003008 [Pseudomonas aeruginosa]
MDDHPLNALAGGLSAEFGFYPQLCDLKTERFSIRSHRNLKAIEVDVVADPGVHKDWIYPGAQRSLDFMSGRVRSLPHAARVFGLPKTHVLTLHQSANAGDLEFAVWCLSFFLGIRLTTEEAGFLDATPIKPGKLVDFILGGGCNEADVLELAMNYLHSERDDPRATKRVAAVINALFMSHYPQSLSFEQFQYLYMALDACFKLMVDKQAAKPPTNHSGRVQWMCEQFDMPVPDWAKHSREIPSSLSGVRNNAFHEALFFDEPLGFSIYGGSQPAADSGNTPLQMQALVSRLLVAILGKPGASYVSTPVDTRQRYALDLRE